MEPLCDDCRAFPATVVLQEGQPPCLCLACARRALGGDDTVGA